MTQLTRTSPDFTGVPSGLRNVLNPVGASANAATATALATPRALSVAGGSTVNFDGTAAAILPQATKFGTGAPSSLTAEGVLYFDTATTPYTAYVQHSGAWHAC